MLKHAVRSSPTDKATTGLASGTVIVLIGQGIFVLCGYFLHFYLSRAIDPTSYGIYAMMMNVLVWTESALSNGVPWAVRKYLPEDPAAAPIILRAGWIWQMLLGSVIYVGAMLLTPWFTDTLRDASLTFYVRLALSDIVWMALYTYYRGVLNGYRMFVAQGIVMAAYALGKLGFSILLVAISHTLNGALVGNVLGSIIGWLVGWYLFHRQPRELPVVATTQRSARQYNGRTILGFALPTMLFTLAGTFLTTVGLLGVKRLVVDGEQVAFYAAANYLANAPTLLLTAFSWTLFPHLAASIASHNHALTRTYIRAAVRYLALVLVPGIALVLGTAPHLMTIIYPPRYAAAAPLLVLLISSTGLYALFMIFANAILAEGRVYLALSIPCALVPVNLLTTGLLTARLGTFGAALAALLSTGLAALVSAVYVLRRFGVRLDGLSLLRIGLASSIVYAATHLYLPRTAWLLPYLGLLGMLYGVLLIALHELDAHELQHGATIMWSKLHGKIAGAQKHGSAG